MAGLDNVTPSETPEKEESGVLGKTTMSIPGVGKIPMQVAVGSDLLKNMEEMIAQRTGGFLNPVLEGMKDAVAVTSRDPGSAMAARDQEKRLERESIFQMRNQIAAIKQAQQQQELVRRSLEGQLGLGGGTGAGGGAGGLPPAIAAQVMEKYRLNDFVGAQAIIDDWNKQERVNISKETYAPESQTQREYNIPGVGLRDLTPRQYRIFEQTGQLPDGTTVTKNSIINTVPTGKGATPVGGARVAADVNNPSGIIIGKDASGKVVYKQYNTPEEGVADTRNLISTYMKGEGPMKGQKVTPENFVGMWVTGDAAKGPTVAKGNYANQVRDELKLAGVKLNADGTIPNTPEALAALTTAVIKHESGANANKFLNVVGTTPTKEAPTKEAPTKEAPVGFVPPQIEPGESKSQYAARVEEAKKDYDAARSIKTKEGEAAAQKYGEQYGDVANHKDTAAKTITAADRVIKLADDPTYKKLMGYFEGGNKAATIIAKGLNWATFKQFGQDEFENAIAALAFTEKEKEKLRELRTDAAQLGIEYTANMFKGARLGIGLEKLGFTGKGVSVDYPAATNKLYAQITKDNAEFVIDAHRKFRDEWAPNHPGKTWGDYVTSKEYDNMLDKHIEKVNSRYPGADVTKTPVGSTPTGSKFDKYRIQK